MSRRGFTLIELLVVIAIIGLLSSVVLASLNSARAKARDARRRSDLSEIRTAMELYYDKYQTYEVSGYGNGGGGQGWFNQDGSPNTVAKGLYDAGFLGTASLDDPKTTPGYMIYWCDGGQRYSISATLENPTAQDIAYIQTTCNGTGSNGTYTLYGKNYAIGN